MSAIPLEGFDPRFLPTCQKCGSHMLNFQWGRHPFMWAQKELRSSCYACGTVKYGEAQIRESYEPPYKRWVRAQEEEARLLKEEEELRKRRIAEELLREQEEERILREEEALRLKREEEELLRQKEEEEARKSLLQKRAQQKREQRARKREKEEARKAAEEKQRQYARDLVRRGEEIKIMVQESLRRQEEQKKRILLEEKGGEKCALDSCENPASATSKYCSRSCSNKNARANYRKKKQAIG